MGKRIRLATLNMKGLGSTVKRRIEALLKKNKVDIVFLQETHQSENGVNVFKMNNIDIYEKMELLNLEV